MDCRHCLALEVQAIPAGAELVPVVDPLHSEGLAAEAEFRHTCLPFRKRPLKIRARPRSSHDHLPRLDDGINRAIVELSLPLRARRRECHSRFSSRLAWTGSVAVAAPGRDRLSHLAAAAATDAVGVTARIAVRAGAAPAAAIARRIRAVAAVAVGNAGAPAPAVARRIRAPAAIAVGEAR